jgi:hypothetical protein
MTSLKRALKVAANILKMETAGLLSDRDVLHRMACLVTLGLAVILVPVIVAVECCRKEQRGWQV